MGKFSLFPAKKGSKIAENVLDSSWNRGHFQFLDQSRVSPLNTEWTYREWNRHLFLFDRVAWSRTLILDALCFKFLCAIDFRARLPNQKQESANFTSHTVYHSNWVCCTVLSVSLFSYFIADNVGDYTHTHTHTWPDIQSEDTTYTRVYSVFVPAFKARTNLCITHSKWGHFFTHLWTCLARTKRGLRPYPPYTHIMAEGGQCT